MIGLDTNVLVRYLTQDDQAQARKVDVVIAESVARGERCVIDPIVLCELIWVLRDAYRTSKADLVKTLDQILATQQFQITEKDRVREACEAYRVGRADFADYLIGTSNRDAGCSETATFDRRLRGASAFRVLLLVVLLAFGAAACSGGGTPAAPTPPPTTTPPATPTPQAPPFSGTIFIDADIITAEDPTTFASLTPNGQGMRTMYDRRAAAFIQLQAYLFNVTFSDGLSTEVQVNPEFGSTDAARVQAEKYAIVIGRLPRALRVSVATVWIHQGVQPFGGGNNNLLIHVGQGDLYIADGILEETFVHEAAHTSLDAAHAASAGWLSAQAKDVNFISTYARDNPTREDVAESVLPWLAVRYRASRITPALAATIQQFIPNRMAYFDTLGLVMLPVQ